MRNSRAAGMAIAVLGIGITCAAQVLPVTSIKDPHSQGLQQQYIERLRAVATDAAKLRFPYHFYFSETLDLDEASQKKLPQGSLRFDRLGTRTVLEITGNYYASYSSTAMTPNQRASQTFQDVVLPLLKVVVAHVDRTVPIDAYGFEIAHHVRTKVLKVDTEGPENLAVIVPRVVAERLAKADDVETRQAALLESEIYLNNEPLTLWISAPDAPADVKDRYLARRSGKADTVETDTPPEPGSLVSSKLIPQSELAIRIRENQKVANDVSPLRLEKLDAKYGDAVQHMIKDLDAQAHFVSYAPPAFIAFHERAYLQLSLITDLEQSGGSSQYRIAALAFDTHIAHLLRASVRYFQDHAEFEGIDFSTSVHQSEKPNSQAVEFVIPFSALACYAKYDCTGQELINRSIVLINGERVSLDLLKAESDVNPSSQ